MLPNTSVTQRDASNTSDGPEVEALPGISLPQNLENNNFPPLQVSKATQVQSDVSHRIKRFHISEFLQFVCFLYNESLNTHTSIVLNYY